MQHLVGGPFKRRKSLEFDDAEAVDYVITSNYVTKYPSSMESITAGRKPRSFACEEYALEFTPTGQSEKGKFALDVGGM
jgi:hypothetical protein